MTELLKFNVFKRLEICHREKEGELFLVWNLAIEEVGLQLKLCKFRENDSANFIRILFCDLKKVLLEILIKNEKLV